MVTCMNKVKIIRGAADLSGDRLPLYLWDDEFVVVEEMPDYSIVMSSIDNRTFKFSNNKLIKIK